MKRCLALGSVSAVSALTAFVATAHAAPATNGTNETVTPPQNLVRTYFPVDATQADLWDVEAHGGPPSRIIYLNNCKPNGCTVRPGNESSINNTSWIPDQTSVVQPFAYSDAVWNQVVECVRATYAPFDVEIVTTDPGNTWHFENLVAGTPGDVQLPNDIGGIAPFSPSCGIVSNAISYSFANIYGPDVDQICWTVAQETAHVFGLEHEYLRSDPMTYLSGSYPKRFQNQAASCGEYSARSCECGGTQQNSFQALRQIFGGAEPTPPMVEITNPAQGDRVAPGFPVHADFNDEQGIDHTELWVDGALEMTIATPPYVFNAPGDLSEGTHRVEVKAYDTQGTVGVDRIDVIIGEPCDIPGDCGGDLMTCVDGRCVPGPGSPGGLGEACTNGSECNSGICAFDGTRNLCTETCEPGAGGCPGGFGCVGDGNGGGVCWPGASDGGEEGGCSAGASAPLSLGLFALGLLAFTRRRRR